jgi:hypothetical protein
MGILLILRYVDVFNVFELRNGLTYLLYGTESQIYFSSSYLV